MMTPIEQLEELYLALEGAVDQLLRAQRIAVARAELPSHNQDLGHGELGDVTRRIEQSMTETVALRNVVREQLLRAKAKGPKVFIRVNKAPE